MEHLTNATPQWLKDEKTETDGHYCWEYGFFDVNLQ